jgi:hypothetical protein
MKVKYVESGILMLPDFNHSIASKGGANYNQIIQWFKSDEDNDFIGLNKEESLTLRELIDTKLGKYLKDSNIKETDEEKIPLLPLYSQRQVPCDYDMSKILDCKKELGFDVKGFIPDLYEM